MPEVAVAVAVPGPEDAAIALWDDPSRWPAFLDGWGAMKRVDPEWPAPGATAVWNSGPHGAGQTRERVVAPGVREMETEQMRGVLTAVYFDGRLHVSLEYELKERTVYTFFFVRRSLRESLRRTAERYAIERRADAEFIS